ncbi:hypothetical protein ACOSQ2_028516 [Xanthoceras sorbifolium]
MTSQLVLIPPEHSTRSNASQSAVAVSEQEKGQARPHYLDPLRQFLDSGSDPPIDLVFEEPALLGPGNDASTRFKNPLQALLWSANATSSTAFSMGNEPNAVSEREQSELRLPHPSRLSTFFTTFPVHGKDRPPNLKFFPGNFNLVDYDNNRDYKQTRDYGRAIRSALSRSLL